MMSGFKTLALEAFFGFITALIIVLAFSFIPPNSPVARVEDVKIYDPFISSKLTSNDVLLGASSEVSRLLRKSENKGFSSLVKEASPPATINIPILIYHYVSWSTDIGDTVRFSLSVSPDNFASQSAYLYENGYKTITLGDLVSTLKFGDKTIPEKAVILTFDDGYRDFYTNVYPILKKYNFKAINFVIYNSMGLSGNLTREQIKEMVDSGLVEIGAHTISHVNLISLPLEKAEKEIVESKIRLEQELGIPIRYFNYPSGFYNESIVEIVRRAGFTAAVSTKKGRIHSLSTIYYLNRVKVGNWDSKTFEKKINE